MKSAKSKQRLNDMRTPARSKQNLCLGERDPVQVYCRLRPMQRDSDVSCMKIISPTTVLLTPPSTAISYRNENNKTMEYTFKEVFPPEASQQEVFDKVALPLVEGLVKGKNGLLFTYGVTGSGKTFTMTGEPQNCGILPRCLNIIFKTINDLQAHKYVFKPDKMNMFDIQNEAEAMLERQQELHKFKSGKKNNSNPDLAMSSTDITKVGGINEDNQYAVFVTYVEIYNNSVFDLLEDGPISKNLPVKIIREDAAHNMYVHGVTEIEIKSAEEAFEAFYLGLKRKRMAHTTLNAESSRSHSVFTIRLVQAPVDEMGEAVIQNKKFLSISQLSLVDLAGSERTNRTKNTGQRLREAGNINKSLMTLRTCLEALRENQANGANNMVPYRESKITHLFKNFFEGEGQVRMVVCANPRAEDYDETLQVMRFAEMAAEVEVAKPQNINNVAASIGLMSGRRKANRLFNTARENIIRPEAKDLELDLGLVYSLGPDFPSLELNSSQAAHIIKELMAHLEMRITRREALKRSKAIKDERLRSALLDLEKDSMEVRSENASLRGQLAASERRVRALEERLTATENASLSHQRKLAELTEYTSSLKRDLQEKELLLSQKQLEKEKQKKILERKYNNKIAAEHEKAKEINSEKERLRNAIEEKENRLRIIAEALHSERGDEMPKSTGDFAAQTGRDFTPGSTPRALPAHLLTPFSSVPQTRETRDTPASSRRGIAVANPRHRRSLSADGRGWIEHAPNKLVPMGTVMKPSISNSKVVNKLKTVKDIANSKASKYCLISQEQDTDGELETKLYKGDVVPTCGGGAQVIFNDVEMLKQFSPNRESQTRVSATSCARHSGKRRDTGCSPPQTPSNTSKKQRIDDD
ncbi:kinesin-like protein KIF23 [Ostrinia furnacalis]|uniref:kinesin-like protein KIF23 n=1 Tax=Ostrinia furnacalis TaxID=93504 RepID=UPI00103D182D|nr:kinesin-like protein KIF23 [Ostrinia furnacalis]